MMGVSERREAIVCSGKSEPEPDCLRTLTHPPPHLNNGKCTLFVCSTSNPFQVRYSIAAVPKL